jgi:hypothetical protein
MTLLSAGCVTPQQVRQIRDIDWQLNAYPHLPIMLRGIKATMLRIQVGSDGAFVRLDFQDGGCCIPTSNEICIMHMQLLKSALQPITKG